MTVGALLSHSQPTAGLLLLIRPHHVPVFDFYLESRSRNSSFSGDDHRSPDPSRYHTDVRQKSLTCKGSLTGVMLFYRTCEIHQMFSAIMMHVWLPKRWNGMTLKVSIQRNQRHILRLVVLLLLSKITLNEMKDQERHRKHVRTWDHGAPLSG